MPTRDNFIPLLQAALQGCIIETPHSDDIRTIVGINHCADISTRPIDGWTGPKLGCEYVTYYALDTFTDDDNTQLVDHVPDMGSAWIATAPDAVTPSPTHHIIENNQLRITFDAAAAVMDLGVADIDIRCDVTLPTVDLATASRFGLFFRSAGNGNGLSFRGRVTADDEVTYDLISWGPLTSIDAGGTTTWTAGQTMTLRVLAVGTSITCLINDMMVIEATSSTNQTATRHGVTSYGSSNIETFDNFSVRQP
jgi:hypothetical protein